MRRMTLLPGLIGLALVSTHLLAQDCMIFNGTDGPFQDIQMDFREHQTGNHYNVATTSGSCTYRSGTAGWCTVTSTASGDSSTYEAGILSTLVDQHVAGAAAKGGRGTGYGGASATAYAEGVGSIRSCFAGLCDVTISISGPLPEGGFSISFPPDALWNSLPIGYGLTCEAESVDPQGGTPIVVDAYGEGFHLTSADKGVTFDVFADGKPIDISWTDPAYHNGWLVLDRNGNGKIDSGEELFGNVTPQPTTPRPNGYLALAVFDTLAAGGNGDGIISSKDAVFSNLRIWIDTNQDGISQPDELHTLPSLGITSLALKYHPSDREDAYGNHFRLQSRVNPDGGDIKDRKDYDVFLVRKK
jgi:hypothetical protein